MMEQRHNHKISNKWVTIQGIRIDALTEDSLFSYVKSLLSKNESNLVTYVNVHTLNVARKDAKLRDIYGRSSLVYCDGTGVVLGARLLGLHLPGSVTSASFINKYCQRWQEDGTRIFFLGGLPGTALEAAQKLSGLYPNLKIVGTSHGYFRIGGEEESAIIKIINDSEPHILFIGFGTPRQEHWALDNFNRLKVPVIWPVGAMVDFVSGRVPRAPQWMRNNYLEWLFRFLIEPRRMFTRYIIGNPRFLFNIILEKARNR